LNNEKIIVSFSFSLYQDSDAREKVHSLDVQKHFIAKKLSLDILMKKSSC